MHSYPERDRNAVTNLDREVYEEDLRRRQEEHLRRARERRNREYESMAPVRAGIVGPWRPCSHDACMECLGTGVRCDGSVCVHSLTCHCPMCTPYI